MVVSTSDCYRVFKVIPFSLKEWCAFRRILKYNIKPFSPRRIIFSPELCYEYTGLPVNFRGRTALQYAVQAGNLRKGSMKRKN